VIIPLDVVERTPLITEAGFRHLRDMLQHPHAPRWNHTLGDRVNAADLQAVGEYRTSVASTDWLERYVIEMRAHSWWFEANVPADFRLVNWDSLPRMTRNNLAEELHLLVPHDADFERLISYTTSGTTGHALVIPTHPRTLALNQTLAERALLIWGIPIHFGPESSVLQVCHRLDTFQFANTFSVWNQCGFAKVNLREDHWPGGLVAAKHFCEHLAPVLVTGDPLAFAALAKLAPDIAPLAMFSTAVTLDEANRPFLERFGCPIIDWYSCTETGPIAFKDPKGQWRFISPDLHVEVLDENGRALPPGIEGDVAVTGGRNPYLPLLRYITGDRAVMAADRQGFDELVGRNEVIFRTSSGRLQGIDIARAMRECSPFLQHRVVQTADGHFDVTIRPILGVTDQIALKATLTDLMGPDFSLHLDPELGLDGKIIPFEIAT
jgi:phenylacetate-CoA ligase